MLEVSLVKKIIRVRSENEERVNRQDENRQGEKENNAVVAQVKKNWQMKKSGKEKGCM